MSEILKETNTYRLEKTTLEMTDISKEIFLEESKELPQSISGDTVPRYVFTIFDEKLTDIVYEALSGISELETSNINDLEWKGNNNVNFTKPKDGKMLVVTTSEMFLEKLKDIICTTDDILKGN